MNPMNPNDPMEQAAEETVPVTGYCRTCGRGLTDLTKRAALGTVYCEEHFPSVNVPPPVDSPSPYAQASPTVASGAPVLAFILGFIPGVGAIFNGQYAKGFVHVVIFGLLVSILESGEFNGGMAPLFGITLGAFVFYQAFEAYHTAKAKAAGITVDEFSSIVPVRSRSGLPVAPILLILAGVLFLMANLGYLHVAQVIRFWPVLLIVLGAWMLGSRLRGEVEPQSHEQR